MENLIDLNIDAEDDNEILENIAQVFLTVAMAIEDKLGN